jgi:hypothetical protein
MSRITLIAIIASFIMITSPSAFAATEFQIDYATISEDTLTLYGGDFESTGPLDLSIGGIPLECDQYADSIVCPLPTGVLSEGTWTVRVTAKVETKKEKETKTEKIDVCYRPGGGDTAPCNPGDIISCYTGDHATLGLGECRAGTRTCLADGTWSDCSGERTPDEFGCCPEDLDTCPGECVDWDTDEYNCGSCGFNCWANAPPNMGSQSCTGGVCDNYCLPHAADCNGTIDDGCETNIMNDEENCGSCGNACPDGFACMAGICGPGPI